MQKIKKQKRIATSEFPDLPDKLSDIPTWEPMVFVKDEHGILDLMLESQLTDQEAYVHEMDAHENFVLVPYAKNRESADKYCNSTRSLDCLYLCLHALCSGVTFSKADRRAMFTDLMTEHNRHKEDGGHTIVCDDDIRKYKELLLGDEE